MPASGSHLPRCRLGRSATTPLSGPTTRSRAVAPYAVSRCGAPARPRTQRTCPRGAPKCPLSTTAALLALGLLREHPRAAVAITFGPDEPTATTRPLRTTREAASPARRPALIGVEGFADLSPGGRTTNSAPGVYRLSTFAESGRRSAVPLTATQRPPAAMLDPFSLGSARKGSAEPLRKGGNRAVARFLKPSAGLEPATPSLPWKCSTN
jgi:hypothetical protein